MITKLTSELNRINQGCRIIYQVGEFEFVCNDRHLCPTCQKEKETLKKVSLMWANEELKKAREARDKYKELIKEIRK